MFGSLTDIKMIQEEDSGYLEKKECRDYILSILSPEDQDSEYYREHIQRYTKTDIQSTRSLERLLARL